MPPPEKFEESSAKARDGKPPAFNVPWVVAALIGFLILVHIVRVLGGENLEVWSIYAFSFIPQRFQTGTDLPQIPGSAWWSLLTSGFLHADWIHLGFNCIWLLVFGTPVARLLGAWRFLMLAAFSTISGCLAVLYVHWGERIFLLGASGAVSGLTAGAIPIMYSEFSRMRQQSLAHTLSFQAYINNTRALSFTAIWLALQIVPMWASGTSSLVTGTAFLDERPIAWEAHLGGFVAGLIAFFILRAQMLSASAKS